ncbi:MAG TPA: fibrinogen-like YCDxxxxGGGW domain-containing protein [Kofleriaceae bacterium]|nr:fibrinogen-like YCDxxxxGGGW domain-containing protein [Kofleriaceae bacterium]
MKWLVLLALCGCQSVLGLDETSFTGNDRDGSIDVPPPLPPDACTGMACSVYTSCKALKMQQPNGASGVYRINAGTGEFPAYCDQTSGGGGWTLALKIDGRLPTFAYDQPIWESPTLLATGATALDHQQAKLETWNAVPFTEVRVAMEFPIDSGQVRAIVLPLAGQRLADLFKAGTPTATNLGRTAWKGLVGPTASLQLNCNSEGANVHYDAMRVRLGIIGNNENDCASTDSRLGVGGGGDGCGAPETQAAGNAACFGGDNGDVDLAAFAWVFVR